MVQRARLTLAVGGITLAILFVLYGIGAFVLWRRARLAEQPSPTPSAPIVFLRETPTTNGTSPLSDILLRPSVTANTDTDHDGLPDDLETTYRTDPLNPDTDGDGYEDGLEVTSGFDPTKPAPEDKVLPAEPRGSPQPPTYTDRFIERTGLGGDPRELLQSDELGTFIAEQNARGFLPEVRDEELNVVTGSGKDIISRYLDAVSTPQNRNITPVSAEEIAVAFRTLTSVKDDQPLRDILVKLERNVTELTAAPAPSEALSLHRQYVAASLALKNNVEALLPYQQDVVGALVAASRIENLRGVFRAVAEGIRDLEKKYHIT